MRQRWLTLVALTACCGASTTADEKPHFQIVLDGELLSVAGQVSSSAHEAIIRQRAERDFNVDGLDIQLASGPSLPPGWALVTEMTLAGVANLHTAEASVTPAGVFVRGTTTSGVAWQAAVEKIQRTLLPSMTLDEAVLEIREGPGLELQCIALFRGALRGRRVEFERSGTDIRPASHALLDELIQIAADCPGALIDIVGHSDSVGEEAVNVAVSRARAENVLAYFISGGIDRKRLSAAGVGSAEPLVDESSTRARALNRRVELTIRFP